jgi:hypothetical protein
MTALVAVLLVALLLVARPVVSWLLGRSGDGLDMRGA